MLNDLKGNFNFFKRPCIKYIKQMVVFIHRANHILRLVDLCAAKTLNLCWLDDCSPVSSEKDS